MRVTFTDPRAFYTASDGRRRLKDSLVGWIRQTVEEVGLDYNQVNIHTSLSEGSIIDRNVTAASLLSGDHSILELFFHMVPHNAASEWVGLPPVLESSRPVPEAERILAGSISSAVQETGELLPEGARQIVKSVAVGGNTVGMVAGSRAYMSYNLGSEEFHEVEFTYFTPWLKALLEAVPSKAEMDQLEDNLGDWMEDQTLESFRMMALERHKRRISTFERDLEEKEEQLQEARERLVSTIRARTTSIEALQSAKELVPDDDAFRKEVEILKSLDEIKSLRAIPGGEDEEDCTLVVRTNEIVLDGDEDIVAQKSADALRDRLDQYSGKMIPLGEFEITISKSSIAVVNKTNPKEGAEGRFHHPHIGTRPCFGSVEQALAELRGHLKYGSAIQLVIQYLKTCDISDSWGRNAYLWLDDAVDKVDYSPSEDEGQEAEVA